MVSLQESMASSTNNSPYETLLDQVTALQSDLSKTFAVCQTLRAENETLAETLTGVKSENVKLRDKYSDIRKRYYDENKQRIEIENTHEEIVRAWKQQLEQKAAEFDKLQANLAPPRDLDLLRMKIQEELEVPHQQKVSKLSADVEKYREMFYNVRREHELLKTEFEQFTIDQGKREEAAQSGHMLQVQNLKNKIANLENARDDTTLKDQVRLLERELQEFRLRENKLKDELSILSEQKQSATIEKERNQLESERIKSEYLATNKTMEARALGAEANVHNFKMQFERAQKRGVDQQKRIADLEHELSRHRVLLEKKEQQMADEASNKSDAIADMARECDQKISEAKSATLKLERQIGRLQQEHQTAIAQVNSGKQVMEESNAAHRREIESLQEQSRLERVELERRLDQADRLVKEANEEKSEAVRASEADKEEVRKYEKKIKSLGERKEKDVEGWKLEKERLLQSVASEKDEYEELKDEYSKLQSEHRELRAKEQALVSEREKLEGNIQYLENEVSRLCEDEERVRLAHKDNSEKLRAQCVIEIKNLRREHKKNMQKNIKTINSLKNDISKAGKKSDEYKKKALSEHKKFSQLKQTFNAMKMDFENSKRKLEVDLSHTKKRLTEVERSRDLLMTGNGDGNGQQIGGDGTGDSTFNTIAQEDQEHQDELKKYLDRLDAM